jgi:arylsulfate sulfotransferase
MLESTWNRSKAFILKPFRDPGPRAGIIPTLTVIILGTLLTVGCGGGATSVTTAPSISPRGGVVLTGQTQPFQVTSGSGGSSSVTWYLDGVEGGNSTVGTIDSNGLYTAPAVPPPFSNLVTLVAQTSSGSASVIITIMSPAPTVASITPPGVTAGNGGLLITVTGAGFTPQSVIEADGTAMTTTFVSDSELTTTLPAASLASVSVTKIVVTTLAPGGGISAALPFTVVSAGVVSTTNNPQVAKYSITSPRDANVTVQFGTDASYGLKTWSRPTPAGGGEVDILVAGMKSFTPYHMQAIVTFPDGTQIADADHTFTTSGPDPVRVPAWNVVLPPGPDTSPGVELYSAFNAQGYDSLVTGYVTDLEGNLIWYYSAADAVGEASFPIKLLPDGNMMVVLVGSGLVSTDLREVDLAGNTVRELTLNSLNQKLLADGFGVQPYSFSHDFAILPNGHLILEMTIERDFTDLPGFPGVTAVDGDLLVDVDQDFNPVWVWNSFDHLDVNRHPYPYGLPDWTHGNAVVYSPDDGNLLFSMRNQSWVIKIEYENGNGNGDVLWRLGYGGDFTMAQGAPAGWEYGQHFPIFLSANTTGKFRLGVYDDGNYRVLDDSGTICGITGTPPCYSRAVIFDVDESAKTVLVEWQDIRQEYTPYLGAIQELPNGDVTFDMGAISNEPSAHVRLVEVTKDSPPRVVWQVEEPQGQSMYRAVRIPSLYPGVQW